MALPKETLPKAPYDDGRASPDYPWIQGSGGLLGDRNTVFANPEKPDQAYTETIRQDGTFGIKEVNGLQTDLAKEKRGYVSGGDGKNTDGQSADYNQSSKLTDVKLDTGSSSGGNSYDAQGGKKIGGAKEGSYSGTDGDTFKTSKGNVATTHKGNMHSATDGDHITTVNGTYYHTVVGQHGINVQKGNSDTKINDGKLRFDVAKNISILSHDQINLNSPEGTGIINLSALNKVILQVGDSSITIEKTKITIKSAAIEFKQ